MHRAISALQHDIARLLDIASAEAAEVERLRVVLARIRDGQCGVCKATAVGQVMPAECQSHDGFWRPVDAEAEARAALEAKTKPA